MDEIRERALVHLLRLLKKTHKLHLQVGRNHWLLYFLNFEKIFSALICFDNEFREIGLL